MKEKPITTNVIAAFKVKATNNLMINFKGKNYCLRGKMQPD